jgi:hypothetical protein
MRLLLGCLSLLLWMSAAHAEQFVRDGDFIVHYVALPSTSITPEVARHFGITRSAGLSLLVLNAQRETAPGKTLSLPATATGTVSSLIGHVQDLELKPAREGDVHYVLAQFQAVDQEILKFDLLITPQGASKPLVLRFQQQFYRD